MFDRNRYEDMLDAGLPHHEADAVARAPRYYGQALPAMPETCKCGATGDLIENPIYCGECVDCGAEACEKCGHTDHDCDGTTVWCATCYDDGC